MRCRPPHFATHTGARSVRHIIDLLEDTANDPQEFTSRRRWRHASRRAVEQRGLTCSSSWWIRRLSVDCPTFGYHLCRKFTCRAETQPSDRRYRLAVYGAKPARGPSRDLLEIRSREGNGRSHRHIRQAHPLVRKDRRSARMLSAEFCCPPAVSDFRRSAVSLPALSLRSDVIFRRSA